MIDGNTLQISAYEALGLAGALLYSLGYLLAAYDRLPSQSPVYYATKLAAASLVLVSLSQHFNLASAVIQVFFIAVSVIGILRHFRPQHARKTYADLHQTPGGAANRSASVIRPGRHLPGAFKVPHPAARPDR